MDFLDLIIAVMLLLNIGLGWAFGLVRRIVVFAGLFAGIGAATLTSANTSMYIANTFGITSALWAHVITYTTIVSLAVALFEVLGAFEVTVMLIIGVGLVRSQLPPGYAYPPAFQTAQDWFNNSLLAPHFYGLEPVTRAIFSLVLPGSVSSYFTQLLNH